MKLIFQVPCLLKFNKIQDVLLEIVLVFRLRLRWNKTKFSKLKFVCIKFLASRTISIFIVFQGIFMFLILFLQIFIFTSALLPSLGSLLLHIKIYPDCCQKTSRYLYNKHGTKTWVYYLFAPCPVQGCFRLRLRLQQNLV